MVTDRKIVIWTMLFSMLLIHFCTCQKLYSDSDTCSGSDEINTFKTQQSALQQLVHNQAVKMEFLEKELISVKEALPKHQSDKIGMFEKEINSLKEALSKFQQANRLEILENEVSLVKETLSKLMPDHIAFHAVASSNSSPGVVIFDHVITNIGSGYNNNSGTFTAPTTGFYVFSWSIETYGQLTEAALIVNGIEMGMTKSDEAPTYYDTSTSFAVLNLTLKDKVWVKVKSGRAEAMHSMFSGWMISKKEKTAFYASLTRTDHYSPIIFNNEILDTDDAYSTTTGKFVAPRSGLYVFMVSGLTIGDHGYVCQFSFSNGISQPSVTVGSYTEKYDSSGYMTFVWMNTNESVHIFSAMMMPSTMFAGWLLIDDTDVSKSTFPAFIAENTLSWRSPVVYDKAHGGYHHGYSTSTGVFTADRDGLYLFLFNTISDQGYAVTALKVNGVEIMNARSDARRAYSDETSAVTVLQLSSNDRVSIVKSGSINTGSLFFGILLFEI